MKYTRIAIAKRLILKWRFEKAKSLLLPLAEKNNSEAQLILGYLYYTRDPKATASISEYWLNKSAKNGNAEAIALIASTNFKTGVTSSEPSNRKRLALTLKAAKKGSAEAQRSLALIYAHGEIVPQDYVLTMYWDARAAKQGLAESQNDLALFLLRGMGGKIDVESAIHWYQQSSSKDHNVPYAEFAAMALAHIYSGDFDSKYADEEKSTYWSKRARYLSKLECRAHPDWFYE